MPVNTPENVSCRQYGDWLQVNWSYVPLESGDTLAGFKVKWGAGALPVSWAVPPAVDAELQGGDGGSPREFYSLLFRISDGLIADWETFETYPTGIVGVMDGGGAKWDGPWSNQESVIGYRGYGDDFESYPEGVQTEPMNGGKGWDGPWATEFDTLISGTTYDTATSISETVPGGALVGDLLLAFIMHRDTVTPPSGWTLVASGSGSMSEVPHQGLSIFSRTAQSGDAGDSFTWTTSTSGRMGAHIIAIHSDKTLSVDDYDVDVFNSVSMATMPVAEATLSGSGYLITAFTAAVAANPSTITAPSGYNLTTPSSVTDNRLGVAIKGTSNETTSGSFTLNNTNTDNGGAAISLAIKES